MEVEEPLASPFQQKTDVYNADTPNVYTSFQLQTHVVITTGGGRENCLLSTLVPIPVDSIKGYGRQVHKPKENW